MKIWLTTDTHFNHAKLLEFGRPDNFEEKILKNLSIIQPGDLLIHLGDFCIGQDAKWHEEFFKRLPGVKTVLVKGNHDGKSYSWYMDHGWGVVCKNMTIKVLGKYVMLSHMPWVDVGYDLNIHGHFHDSDHRRHEPELVAIKNDKQLLLAIELTGYKPVLITSLLTSS